jgi:hypothetical protein
VRRVATVLNGDAGRFGKPLENNENKLQHMQHENARLRNNARGVFLCPARGSFWLGN